MAIAPQPSIKYRFSEFQEKNSRSVRKRSTKVSSQNLVLFQKWQIKTARNSSLIIFTAFLQVRISMSSRRLTMRYLTCLLGEIIQKVLKQIPTVYPIEQVQVYMQKGIREKHALLDIFWVFRWRWLSTIEGKQKLARVVVRTSSLAEMPENFMNWPSVERRIPRAIDKLMTASQSLIASQS